VRATSFLLLLAVSQIGIVSPIAAGRAAKKESDEVWVGTITIRYTHSWDRRRGGSDWSINRGSLHQNTTYRVGPLKAVPNEEGTTEWMGPSVFTTSGGRQEYSEDQRSTFQYWDSCSGSNTDDAGYFDLDEPGSRRFHITIRPDKSVPRQRWSTTKYKPGHCPMHTKGDCSGCRTSDASDDTMWPTHAEIEGALDADSTSTVGTKNYKDNGGEYVYTWNLRRIGKTDIEAVMTPPKAFNYWMPQGNRDPDRPGNTIVVNVRAHVRGDPSARRKAVHTRTDPRAKDMFINNPSGLPGVPLFTGASGLAVHEIDKTEFADEPGSPNTAVINCNRGQAKLGTQHLLVLLKRDLPGGIMGQALGDKTGPPRETVCVAVNEAEFADAPRGLLPVVVAHEMSHGCNVSHHGEEDYTATDVEWMPYSTNTWQKMEDMPFFTVAAKRG